MSEPMNYSDEYKEQLNYETMRQTLQYGLMDESAQPSYAILAFLEKSEEYFPRRFDHHTAFKDPSIALANLTPEEKRQMKARLVLVQLFEMARRFRFETETDYMFFQDIVNEEVYFTKNLSLGDGSLLKMLQTSMKIIDIAAGRREQQQEKKNWFGFRR